MRDLNTPIWQLTIGEFMEVQRKCNVEDCVVKESVNKSENTRRYVYGLKGLATLLGCSVTTAQELKSSGKIDSAFSQFGRKIVFDADKVLDFKNKRGNNMD